MYIINSLLVKSNYACDTTLSSTTVLLPPTQYLGSHLGLAIAELCCHYPVFLLPQNNPTEEKEISLQYDYWIQFRNEINLTMYTYNKII